MKCSNNQKCTAVALWIQYLLAFGMLTGLIIGILACLAFFLGRLL